LNTIIFKHIVYNYIFIALCATAMAFQTDLWVNTKHIEIEYYGFIFFATLFSYHIYYLKSIQNKWHITYAIISSICAVFILFKLNIQSLTTLVQIVLLSSSYIFISLFNLKNKWLSIYKLFALSTVWFLTTTILPLKNWQSIYEYPLFFIHQFVFIFLLCFHFYIRDEVNEELKSRYTLGVIIANVILIILSFFLCILMPGWLFINILFLMLSIYIYKKKPVNSFYLIFVDGLLLLQPILVIVLQLLINDNFVNFQR
jgi:hypothetical protein